MPTFSSVSASRKHWKPFDGPADWDFIVLNSPKKGLEDGRDERPEVSNG
jgi:hypothetical protein